MKNFIEVSNPTTDGTVELIGTMHIVKVMPISGSDVAQSGGYIPKGAQARIITVLNAVYCTQSYHEVAHAIAEATA